MNYPEAITKNFHGINDSTLREGEQYNSSKFSLDDQISILRWLHLIGIDTAEVGNPYLDEIRADIQQLSKQVERPKLMAHIRVSQKDFNATKGTGIDGVHMMAAVDPTRLALIGQSLSEHIDTMTQLVRQAKDDNLAVRVSVEHGLESRFFPDALTVLKAADMLEVDRVQIADTRGDMFPWEVYAHVALLRNEISTDIGIHPHNDFGHAVYNALSGLAAGANWVDTTLMGIGERTGITALSTFLSNLYKISPELTKRYTLELLTKAERALAKILKISVPHNLITNKNAFSHKAGIHIKGIHMQGFDTYEPINPAVVGNKRRIVTDSRISGGRRVQGTVTT